MHEYAFDIHLNTTARTYADTEAQAREHLQALDWEFQIDYRTDKAGGEVWLTDASMAHNNAEARRVEPHCDQVTLIPLYRAGGGFPHTALDVIKQPGWACYEDATGDNCTWASPDRELSVEFGPEIDSPALAPLWRIRYRNPDPYRPHENSFTAYFDGDTPTEAIAAFLTALTAPSPRNAEPQIAASAASVASKDQ